MKSDAENLFYKSEDIPLVGLINKNTGEIVLARCIPERVELMLGKEGEVLGGRFYAQSRRSCDPEELKIITAQLSKRYLPRLAYTFDGIGKTSHDLLFEQKGLLDRAEWGGFTVTWNEHKINFTYTSGGFNSPPGQRIRGSQLDLLLQKQVLSILTSWYESRGQRINSNKVQEFKDVLTNMRLNNEVCRNTYPCP